MREAKPGAKRLLLVEDNDLLRRCMSRALHAYGYEVLAACCVAEAVELARRFAVDVVLTDYHLPDGTGADAFNQVRQTQDVPAVLLTAEPEAVGSDAQLFAEVFAKPSPMVSVIAALDRLSESRDTHIRELGASRDEAVVASSRAPGHSRRS